MPDLWAAESGWALEAAGPSVRPGDRLLLVHRAAAVPARDVVIERDGPGVEPIRFGEPVRIIPPDAVGVPVPGAPAATWRVTGGAVGTAVGVRRPVGLFDDLTGDHLAATPDGRLVGWTTLGRDGGPDPFAGRPPLAVPWGLRTVGGVVAQVVVTGPVVRRADGVALAVDDGAGVRLPGTVTIALPEGVVAPPDGTRLLVAGVLVRVGDDVVLDPVDGLAWAAAEDGSALGVTAREPQWPAVAVVWHALVLPTPPPDRLAAVYAKGPRPVTWYLALPSRDGEPGSTTTSVTTAPGRLSAPAIVRHPVGRSRVLRWAPSAGPASTCTVRVHVRGR